MNETHGTIQPGATVYTSDDHNLGTVSEVGTNYVLVQKGLIFITDRYIPLSAIASADGDRVILNTSRDQVEQMDWEQAPPATASASASTGASAVSDHTVRSTQSTGQPHQQTTTGTARDELRVPIVEEQINIEKRGVERGGVRVQTNVTETPVNEQVTLRDETVNVERRPVNREVAPGEIDQLREGTFEVRERDEEAVVNKQARVVEEVVINKQAQERTENVQDTVRRTDVDVQKLAGETHTTGASTSNVDYDTTRSSGANRTRTATEHDVQGADNALHRAGGKIERGVEDLTGSDLNNSGGVGDGRG